MTGDRNASKNQSDTGAPRRATPDSSRGRVRFDGGSDPGRDRHRILRELRGELARHPAVRSIEGEPPDEYQELRATLGPSWFGRTAETASLRVTWIPDPSPGPEAADRTNDAWMRTPIQAYYTIHYSESDGFDCGFHCEPNPHVDGLLHYQERDDADDTYTHEPVSFGARSVSGLLWELMDALADRLDDSE
ncbi:hypothetical protein JCM18750_31390 [Halostagnicola bangensis]